MLGSALLLSRVCSEQRNSLASPERGLTGFLRAPVAEGFVMVDYEEDLKKEEAKAARLERNAKWLCRFSVVLAVAFFLALIVVFNLRSR